MSDHAQLSGLTHIAMELNDMAVGLYQCNDLRGAELLYTSALAVMSDYTDLKQASLEHSIHELVAMWSTKLLEQRTRAKERRFQQYNDCFHRKSQDASLHCDTQFMSAFLLHNNEEVEKDDAALTVAILRNMGLVYALQGKLSTAMKFLYMALALPTISVNVFSMVSIRYVLSAIHSQEGRYGEALEELKEALCLVNTCPTDESNLIRVKLLNEIGHILFSEGYVGDAVEVLDSALLIQSKEWSTRRACSIAAAAA